jgi:hypothetical protein
MTAMRKLLALVFLVTYAFAFVGSNAATGMTSGQVVKIKIVHSHEHGSDHEHHHTGDKSTPGKNDSAPNPHKGDHHSHEISVGSSLVVAAGEFRLERLFVVVEAAKFPSLDQRIPKSPALLGIFRPPIA